MIFQWIKDYINDIKISWMMVRYKRSKNSSYAYDQYMMSRMEQRQNLWSNDHIHVMNNYNAQFQAAGGGNGGAYGTGGGASGDEWSNGPDNGYKIIKRVDAGGKAIGICTRWDLFYFMMKDKDELKYNNFIYLSTDGISKHDWHVEVIGIDLV